MEIPTYLLGLLGVLGAVDIVCYHAVAHGIRSHQESAKELLCHSLRGPTYALLFVLIPIFRMEGLFAWGLLGLLAFDVSISVWDFWLEQDSRRFLGGLPSGEYVLHMMMAMVFGAMVATLVYLAGSSLLAPTRVVYWPAVNTGVRLVMLIMAALVLISGVQDAVAAYKLARARPKNP